MELKFVWQFFFFVCINIWVIKWFSVFLGGSIIRSQNQTSERLADRPPPNICGYFQRGMQSFANEKR